MGMAAGQARFIQLTARKSNVEFQGEQINQQRTTLSNVSSSYNTQLLSLQVPTPPSVASFTSTVYSWQDDAGTNNTITSLIPVAGDQTGTQYKIGYHYTTSASGAYQVNSDRTDAVTRSVTGTPPVTTYSINGIPLTPVTDVNALATLRTRTSATDNFYSYTNTATNKTYYYSGTELADPAEWIDDGAPAINKYLIGTHDQTVSVDAASSNAPTGTIERSNDGRISNIVINGTTYAVTTKSGTDEAAYDDAMNKYEFDKAQYEKEMNDINSKLSLIQQQDKNLELQLKQCDTEQQAISNEMDAVKKVVDKNVESTFKTFA